jgi:tRNA uridine 5-carboxymethylaminomethyl modification enzyme
MTTLEELLRRPHVHYPVLANKGAGSDPASGLTRGEQECVEIEIKYAGFIVRQQKQLEQVAAKAGRKIPEDIDYAGIGTLSLEAREKLGKIRPRDIGQAGRIGGVSPADVSALLLHLEVARRRGEAAAAAPAPAAVEGAAGGVPAVAPTAR